MLAEIDGLTDHRHLALGVVASTNDEAMARGRAGDPGNLWITAERQRRGRGRQGARWASEPGNLYASLLMRPGADPARDPQLPLVSAVALFDAIAESAGPALGDRLRIKWPNDLLLDGRKVSGILAEAGEAPRGRFVVIGFGVNCAQHPLDAEGPTISLAAAGLPVRPHELFEMLARTFAMRRLEWADGKGFATVRRVWLDRAAGLHRPIRVRLPEGVLDGVFAGLDPDGRLILSQATGERRISAGEVFFANAVMRGRTA